MTGPEILREVVPPLAAVYALVLAMLPAGRRERSERRPWPPRGSSAVTIVAGSAVFLAIVAVFQSLATGDRTALGDAVTGGAVLLGVSLGGFAVLSAGDRLLRRRPPRSSRTPRGAPPRRAREPRPSRR